MEVRGDEVADISFDGSQVLRAVKAVIRNQDWETLPSQRVAAQFDKSGLEIEARFTGLGGDFVGTLTVKATDDTLAFSLTLRAHAPFQRNRAGLVALLPADLAGTPLRVRHPDGTIDATALPTSIAPHQPALDIESLAWTHRGIDVDLTLRGDAFEMEDQRNWSDASFKVYSTPLSLPFPVALDTGALVTQGLELRASRIAPPPSTNDADVIELCVAERNVPSIGTSASTGPDPIAAANHLGAILVELDLTGASWRKALDRASMEAAGAPLDVRLIADDPATIEAAVAAVAPLEPVRISVTDAHSHVTTPSVWDALMQATGAFRLDAELVGGTRAHFTELTRNHKQIPPELPSLTFSSTPQMHARDRAQLVESIAMQRLIALDAVRIAAGRPLHVGPITLRPRFNAVATSTPSPQPAHLTQGYGPALLDSATDPRQSSTALAAWTVASAAALAVAGVSSLSFFEASGPRGITGYPVAEAFSWLRELVGHPLLESVVAIRPGIWIIGAQTPSGPTILVANLNSESIDVSLRLDESSANVRVGPLSVRRVALR